MLLPQYFKNLTLAISSITGIPRICSVREDKGYFVTDKYKDIPRETWLNCLMLYFDKQQQNCKPNVCVAVDKSDGKLYYVTGGSFRDKGELLLHIETIKSELVKQFESWEQEYEQK